MKLPPPDTPSTYTIFLSSGDDVFRLRNLVETLINEVFNAQLGLGKKGVLLRVIRWEQVAAHRPEDMAPLQFFVQLALESHVTLVLLKDELRPGTLAEVQAVLEQPDGPQLAVLRFNARSEDATPDDIDEFFKSVRDKIIYRDKLGSPTSRGAWMAIVNQLLAITLSVLPTGETLYEIR